MNKKIIPYLIGYLLLLAIACGLLLSYPKAELHLLLNSHHTPAADMFCKYYTILAEWPLYVIAIIPLCFRKWRWTLWYALSEGSAALVIFVLKRVYREPRPVAFFEDIKDATLPLVDGVRMHHSNSFPSGHSSTFFVFFTFAALLLCYCYKREKDNLRPVLQNTLTQQLTLIGLLVMATVGCLSRVYLSQHFLSDIAAGSCVGVVVPCVMFWFFSKKIMTK